MDGRRVVLLPVGSPDNDGSSDDVDDRQIIETSRDTHGDISTTEDTQNIQTSQSGRSLTRPLPSSLNQTRHRITRTFRAKNGNMCRSEAQERNSYSSLTLHNLNR